MAQQLELKARNIRTVASKPTVESLPNEVLSEIFEYLAMPDWKHLRLCNKVMEKHAVRFVFRNIHLSLAKSHTEAFFAISENEELCKIPRQLTWYECDSRIFVSQEVPEKGQSDPFDNGKINDYEKPLYQDLARRTTADCTWWPIEKIQRTATENTPMVVQAALMDFVQRLNSAIAAMPTLHRFVYRPWPTHLPLPGKGYSFTGDVIGQLEFRVRRDGPSCMGLHVMLTYMWRNPNPFKSLYWIDSDNWSTFCCVSDSQVEAFKNLTTIDLCLTALRGKPEKEAFDMKERLADCLLRARELTHLTLCFEGKRGEDSFPLTFLTECQKSQGMSFPPLFLDPYEKNEWSSTQESSSVPFWSKLSFLRLVDLRFSEAEILGLLKRQARSLRHLVLEECVLLPKPPLAIRFEDGDWKDLVQAMANTNEFKLESIKILQIGGADYKSEISEDAILQFINSNGPYPFSNLPSNSGFNTHRVISDYDFMAQSDRLNTPAKDIESVTELKDWDPVLTSSWILRRVFDHIVWWSCNDADSRGYETECWRFERADGSFAYGLEPFSYFSDWGSELGSEPGDSDSLEFTENDVLESDDNGNRNITEVSSSDDETSKTSETSENSESVMHDTATETPFGLSFEAFCKNSTWEGCDPAVLQFPPHAMILVDGQTSMKWHTYRKEYLESREKARLSLEDLWRKTDRID
ncbi:hypothetical protein MMC10_004539 [Thelotrema lepadinum]|nr:hypothetical protein [Thelotrema lepadinum]